MIGVSPGAQSIYNELAIQRQGERARSEDRAFEANPYVPGDRRAELWEYGWKIEDHALEFLVWQEKTYDVE